jgi:hypothetical protein
MTTVITVAGQKGETSFKGGTLAESTLGSPRHICVDEEGNIFGASTCTFMLNEERDFVMQMPGAVVGGGAPAIDITGKIVLFPEGSGDGYYTYDADLQWASRRRLILHPTTEEIAAGKKDFPVISWKINFATSQVDGMVYAYDWAGNLIKFDPVSRKGEFVRSFRNIFGTVFAFLNFHPVEKEELYMALQNGAIYAYNIITDELKLVAGTQSVRGYRDGSFEDALFGLMEQYVFDENLDIIVADGGNHCIRKLNMKDRIVTTLIGKGGVAGYVDGNPEDALFREPYGMCIDKNYNIYIADQGNNCIRKLVTQ